MEGILGIQILTTLEWNIYYGCKFLYTCKTGVEGVLCEARFDLISFWNNVSIEKNIKILLGKKEDTHDLCCVFDLFVFVLLPVSLDCLIMIASSVFSNVFWVREWLLFNANSAIFQLYHGENKLYFEMMMMMISALH